MQARFTFMGAARMNARAQSRRSIIGGPCVVRLVPEYTIGVELIGEHDRQNDNYPD